MMSMDFGLPSLVAPLEAAIKLGHWSDALQAADDALALDDEAGTGWAMGHGSLAAGH